MVTYQSTLNPAAIIYHQLVGQGDKVSLPRFIIW
jgi:hypothetical protein